MNRREFIKKTTMAGVAGIGLVSSLDTIKAAAGGQDVQSELIIAYGGEPAQLLKAALKKYGGLGKVVKPGMNVAIKANFTWWGPPEQACDTNPDLLAALVKECLKEGAKQVKVIDLTLDPVDMCLDASGIRKAVEKAGGVIVDLRTTKRIKKAVGVLEDINFRIFKEVEDTDCLINVPIVKTHSICEVSCAVKSLMGLTPDRDPMHAVGIDEAIVDLAKIIKPQLHIIDAYRILKTNGPKGPGEVELTKQLILTHDPVAGDAYAQTLLNKKARHIQLAAEAGLGCADLSKVKITKVKA